MHSPLLRFLSILTPRFFPIWRGQLLVGLMVGFAGSLSIGAPSPFRMEHRILHRDDTQYYLGASLLQQPNGDLLLGLREAHARPPGQSSHVDLTSRGVTLRSHDGGLTFGQKRVLDDETKRFSATQDVTLSRLRDGTLIASFYTWRIVQKEPPPLPGPDHVAAPTETLYTPVFEGLWTKVSTDEGRSWSQRRAVIPEGVPPLAGRAPLIEADDGSWLLLVNDCRMGENGKRRHARVLCIASSDRGVSWKERALVGGGERHGVHFVEPGWVRLKSGRLIALLRAHGSGLDPNHPGVGHVYQSVSDDEGKTWSEPVRNGIWGMPAQAIELSDGRLLCVYGYRRAPFGIRAVLSYDQGASWDIANEVVLRADGGNWDLGYPVALEVEPRKVLVAYYFNQERPGEPESATRYIAGTFLSW